MRTALSIIAGYAIWTVMWLGGGAGIRTAFPEAFPDGGPFTAALPLVLTLLLSIGCSFAAGLVATKLANESAGTAVLVMAALLLITGIGVQASIWNQMPLWFHIPFLALLIPVCFLGKRAVAA